MLHIHIKTLHSYHARSNTDMILHNDAARKQRGIRMNIPQDFHCRSKMYASMIVKRKN